MTKFAKATNLEFDQFVWVLYDTAYVMEETWIVDVATYTAELHHLPHMRPALMRAVGRRVLPVTA